MPVIELHGLRIRYRERGGAHAASPAAGPALLLLHGAGASSLGFGALINLVGQRRRVVALDLPGHGGSAQLTAALPPERLLDHYREVVAELGERLGLGRFVLVGHSMGGALAQRFALCFPDRLAALVLIASGTRLPVDAQVLQILERRFHRARALLAATTFSPATGAAQAERWAELQLQAPQAVVLADFRACQRFDVRAALARRDDGAPGHCPDWPTLVIGGADDLVTPPPLLRELAQRWSRSRLVLLPRAGHQVHLERLEAVAQLLLEVEAGRLSAAASASPRVWKSATSFAGEER